MHKHGDTQAFGKIFMTINQSNAQTIYYITKIFGEETAIRNVGQENMRHLNKEELNRIREYEEAERYVHRLEQQTIDNENHPEYRAGYNSVGALREFYAFEDRYDCELQNEKQKLRCAIRSLCCIGPKS